ncbi:hypothetical protein AB0H77_36300 [Streptomyces sp. NPDC050844]|uniref:hypothetical protein n=1 Tax=Streptomyces sp. NPDC050844 TaxID=3155790 RepID=UPI0033FCB104
MSTSVGQATLTICPTRSDHSAPTPDTLAYSLTLPSALTTPAIARAATRTVLAAHGLAALAAPATQIVAELTATACQFSAAAEVYVSLRFREGSRAEGRGCGRRCCTAEARRTR